MPPSSFFFVAQALLPVLLGVLLCELRAPTSVSSVLNLFSFLPLSIHRSPTSQPFVLHPVQGIQSPLETPNVRSTRNRRPRLQLPPHRRDRQIPQLPGNGPRPRRFRRRHGHRRRPPRQSHRQIERVPPRLHRPRKNLHPPEHRRLLFRRRSHPHRAPRPRSRPLQLDQARSHRRRKNPVPRHRTTHPSHKSSSQRRLRRPPLHQRRSHRRSQAHRRRRRRRHAARRTNRLRPRHPESRQSPHPPRTHHRS